MVFADNMLQLEHKDGFGVRFIALEALRLVDTKDDTIKVADAEVWKKTRQMQFFYIYMFLLTQTNNLDI